MDLEPCKDVVGSVRSTTSIATIQDQHESHSGQDQCPPMCHCGCCNMQVVFTKKIIIRAVETKLTTVTDAYLPEKPVTRPTNIWQPPKLAA
ncbi:hypothetical protein GCM10023313_11790 [Mucilaginibacter defluvii]|uniref:Uncharacterized protein n=2 Tax=Mucilaginibacter defluvii TaxID=1196019 RepID=A0ABP9FP76_9SPHI